ncbi:tetratricopeptide repeat protein, partial [bacterium]
LRERMDLVRLRDDLTLEFVALLNATGRPEDAVGILDGRRFQPWEGGEGIALGAFTRTHLVLTERAVLNGDQDAARHHLERVLHPPENLGEARHLLANASDLWLIVGDALAALGEPEAARSWWTRAADFRGDFQEMSVRTVSEMSYFQAIALQRLGRGEEARQKHLDIRAYAEELARTEAKIDYFATSLPTMLLFDDDLQIRQENTARFLLAQSMVGLGQGDEAMPLLDEVLRVDPNHALASDLRAKQRSFLAA